MPRTPRRDGFPGVVMGGRTMVADAAAQRVVGVVSWYCPARGFGFVRPDDGSPEVFVGYEDLPSGGFRMLREGQRISFFLGNDGQGPRASQVLADFTSAG